MLQASANGSLLTPNYLRIPSSNVRNSLSLLLSIFCGADFPPHFSLRTQDGMEEGVGLGWSCQLQIFKLISSARGRSGTGGSLGCVGVGWTRELSISPLTGSNPKDTWWKDGMNNSASTRSRTHVFSRKEESREPQVPSFKPIRAKSSSFRAWLLSAV